MRKEDETDSETETNSLKEIPITLSLSEDFCLLANGQRLYWPVYKDEKNRRFFPESIDNLPPDGEWPDFLRRWIQQWIPIRGEIGKITDEVQNWLAGINGRIGYFDRTNLNTSFKYTAIVIYFYEGHSAEQRICLYTSTTPNATAIGLWEEAIIGRGTKPGGCC
jgi:hypothetical protein